MGKTVPTIYLRIMWSGPHHSPGTSIGNIKFGPYGIGCPEDYQVKGKKKNGKFGQFLKIIFCSGPTTLTKLSGNSSRYKKSIGKLQKYFCFESLLQAKSAFKLHCNMTFWKKSFFLSRQFTMIVWNGSPPGNEHLIEFLGGGYGFFERRTSTASV